jgi:hypothetical protein
VGIDDLPNITDTCEAIGASGFLLACSTQPSSGVVRRFEEIEGRGKLVIRYWDSIEIEKRLYAPQAFPLIHLFLPASSSGNPWQIYATDSPSLWAGNCKDYFLYLSSRTAHSFPSLGDVEEIIKRLENIKLPEGTEWHRHYLRPRAVYFDNVHEQFMVFADYLYPKQCLSDAMQPADLNAALKDGMGLYADETSMWYVTHWDIRYVPSMQIGDHFHLDHQDYYEPFKENFRRGLTQLRQILA